MSEDESIGYIDNNDYQEQDTEYLLLKATEQNDLPVLQNLIDQGVSPNFVFTKYNGKETTPLREAIAHSHDEMVDLIIKTDPKTIDKYVLFVALTAKDGNFNRQTVQLLLSNRASISIDLIRQVKDIDALHYCAICAVNTDRVDILKLLLSTGISLDFQITDYLDLQTSPLDRTISLNKPAIARFLLKEAKVDPNKRINGFSPLIQAIENRRFELVTMILKFGGVFYDSTTESE